VVVTFRLNNQRSSSNNRHFKASLNPYSHRRPVCVKHDAQMRHGQSRGKPKTKRNKNWGKFINLAEIGGICIIGEGMDAPAYSFWEPAWDFGGSGNKGIRSSYKSL